MAVGINHADIDHDRQRLGVLMRRMTLKTRFAKSENFPVQTVPLLQSRRRMIVFVNLALSWLAASFARSWLIIAIVHLLTYPTKS